MNQPYTQPVDEQAPKNGGLALLALAISAFGIGTTEFVPVGLLASIASDLNIGITLAGHHHLGYAIGVALGAPILDGADESNESQDVTLSLMLVFIGGNLISAPSQAVSNY